VKRVTHDPSDGSDRGRNDSGRLWTDPRDEQEHTHWLQARTEVRPPQAEHEDVPAGEPPARPVWQLVVLGTLIAFVLFGAGVLGAALLRGGDSGSNLAALPAAPGAAAPDARARAIRTIYARVSPSVVRVRVSEGGGTEATGTGFVIDKGGTIVTNAHVVGTATRAQVLLNDDASAIDAQILGRDASSDLAVLRVDSDKTSHLRPLPLADSGGVHVGDLAIAIGYPLGLDRSVTSGIVSGVGRAIKAPNGFSIDKVIQTDASINPGNSGGPLLDSAGRVIGVNSQIATAGGGGNVGIGFAIPSNTVRQVVPGLERGVAIRRAYLGVTTEPTPDDNGAKVFNLVPGGPADANGLQIDDVIVDAGGKQVLRPDDVSAAVEARKPGDKIAIEVRRAGTTRTLHVTLGTRPNTAGTP
jgi:putative serine protease PepD